MTELKSLNQTKITHEGEVGTKYQPYLGGNLQMIATGQGKSETILKK